MLHRAVDWLEHAPSLRCDGRTLYVIRRERLTLLSLLQPPTRALAVCTARTRYALQCGRLFTRAGS